MLRGPTFIYVRFLPIVNLRSGSIFVSHGKPIPANARATPKSINKSDAKIRPDHRLPKRPRIEA